MMSFRLKGTEKRVTGQNRFAIEEGCTILISLGHSSGDGRTIVAKNRDVSSVSPAEIMVLDMPKGGNKYLGISTIENSSGLTLGINEKGVISTMAGRYCWKSNNPGVNSGVINKRGLQSVHSAKEMAAKIQEIVETEGKSKNGAAFTCADPKEGYVVETYQKISEVYGPLKDAVFAYGNYTLTEKMKQYEKKSRGHRRGKRAQELMEKFKGELTVPLLIQFCRDHEQTPDQAFIWDDNTICTHGFSMDTRGSGICVATKRYPELLNVIWAALNNPCKTPYIPFYMGTAQIPEEYATPKAYETFEALAMALEEIPKFKQHVRQYWEAFEFQTLREASFLEKKVKELAENGKEDEAKEMLTEFITIKARKAVEDARKITERILQESLISYSSKDN